MFAYLGLESATVPAGDVRDPERTIPHATVLGILIAALLYVLGTVVVLGVVPRDQLVTSIAPFSDAARMMWGEWAAAIIAVAVIVSSIGALNGWTLLMGQVPMAAAQDQLFPAVFGRLSSHHVPAMGIVLSAMLATGLVLIQTSGSPGFAAVYTMLVSLATMTGVIAYVFCALADGLIAVGGVARGMLPRIGAVEVIAFLFSIFTVYGCGPTPVLYGLLLLLFGIPVYVWQQRERAKAVAAHRVP
jgi:arginine:agmatine antiporter